MKNIFGIRQHLPTPPRRGTAECPKSSPGCSAMGRPLRPGRVEFLAAFLGLQPAPLKQVNFNSLERLRRSQNDARDSRPGNANTAPVWPRTTCLCVCAVEVHVHARILSHPQLCPVDVCEARQLVTPESPAQHSASVARLFLAVPADTPRFVRWPRRGKPASPFTTPHGPMDTASRKQSWVSSWPDDAKRLLSLPNSTSRLFAHRFGSALPSPRP